MITPISSLRQRMPEPPDPDQLELKLAPRRYETKALAAVRLEIVGAHVGETCCHRGLLSPRPSDSAAPSPYPGAQDRRCGQM